MFFWLTYYTIWLPIHLFRPFKVINRDNFDKKKNYIIICNHQSAYDPFILDFGFRKKIRFIAKKELFKNKFSNFMLKNVLGALPIDREKGLTISQTKEIYSIIKNGENLGIFPEGTRKVSLKENDSLKGGACLFAIKTRTPILPCFILNKSEIFKKNTLIIGKPFELSQFYDKKLDKENISNAESILKNKILDIGNSYKKILEEEKIIKQLKKIKRKNK